MPGCDAPVSDAQLGCCDGCRRRLLAAAAAHLWRQEREAYVADLIDRRDELAGQLSEERIDGLTRVLARYVEPDSHGRLRLRAGVEHYLDLLTVTPPEGEV